MLKGNFDGVTLPTVDFPSPVNEVSARLVAGGVLLMALAAIVFDQPWLTAVIAYGAEEQRDNRLRHLALVS